MTKPSPESRLGQALGHNGVVGRLAVRHMRFSHPGFPAEYPSPVLEAAMTSAPPPAPRDPSLETRDPDDTEAWPAPAPKSGGEGPEDDEEVSEQHLDQGGAKLARVAEPPERQAVDVKPMYFVLSIGLFGAALAMFLAFVVLKASGAL